MGRKTYSARLAEAHLSLENGSSGHSNERLYYQANKWRPNMAFMEMHLAELVHPREDGAILANIEFLHVFPQLLLGKDHIVWSGNDGIH